VKKIENYFIFEMLKKKVWAYFQRLMELFTQKFSLGSQKYGFGIRDPEKTYSGSRIQDPGVKKAPDSASGSATLFVIKSCYKGGHSSVSLKLVILTMEA
jgi:hypothetical protein